MKDDADNETEGFIRLSQIVPGLIPVSQSTIWRWVRQRKFPAPLKLTRGVTAWRRADVKSWLTRGDL